MPSEPALACDTYVTNPSLPCRASVSRTMGGSYPTKYPRGSRPHLLKERAQRLAHLASLVPPPRHPLVRYVGALSSASRWHEHVVPKAVGDQDHGRVMHLPRAIPTFRRSFQPQHATYEQPTWPRSKPGSSPAPVQILSAQPQNAK